MQPGSSIFRMTEGMLFPAEHPIEFRGLEPCGRSRRLKDFVATGGKQSCGNAAW
jgi:hypothetical protein